MVRLLVVIIILERCVFFFFRDASRNLFQFYVHSFVIVTEVSANVISNVSSQCVNTL